MTTGRNWETIPRRNAARALGNWATMSRARTVRCLNCSDYYVRQLPSLWKCCATLCSTSLAAAPSRRCGSCSTSTGRPHLTQPYEAVLEALGSPGNNCSSDPTLPGASGGTVQYGAPTRCQLTRMTPMGSAWVQALEESDLNCAG